jgi:hypothetical protein
MSIVFAKSANLRIDAEQNAKRPGPDGCNVIYLMTLRSILQGFSLWASLSAPPSG